MKKLLFFFFVPFLLLANTHEYYAEQFADAFFDEDLELCDDILVEWGENCYPTDKLIFSLVCSLRIAKGDVTQAINDLTLFFENEEIFFPSRKEFPPNDVFSSRFSSESSIPQKMLCKSKQPPGVQLRYWFGFAQILAGCVIAPFSGPAGAGLITTGVSTVVHAGADCVDNLEKLEENERNKKKFDELLKNDALHNWTPPSLKMHTSDHLLFHDEMFLVAV